MSEVKADRLTELAKSLRYRRLAEGPLILKQDAEMMDEAAKVVEAVAGAKEALERCEGYFDETADAEYFTDRAAPVPNEEMRLLSTVRDALAALDNLENVT